MRTRCLFLILVFRVAPAHATVFDADICVFGGTSGGVAAAVQAARMGKTVVLLEPGRHLGGMTSGGLSAVDIGDPRSVGGIAREVFTRIAATAGVTLAWDRDFKGDGGGGPATGGAYAIEPHKAEQVFTDMAREAGVAVHFGARLASVRKDGARITELVMENGDVFRAKAFIDTTYEGDLMAKAGVSYTLMREGRGLYGESHAGIIYEEKYRPRTEHLKPGPHGRVPGGQGVWDRDFPLDPYVVRGDPSSGLLPLVQAGDPGEPGDSAPGVQAYCYRLCLTTTPANRIPISPPPDYDPGRYEIVARFIEACLAIGDEMDLRWFSKHDPLPNEKWDFNTATFGGNLPGASWAWPEASYAQREAIAKEHENYHRGLLHFLATDPRVPEKVRRDMRRFGLPKDEFTDNGGWPHQIYVRQGRRMVGDFVMTEHHTFGRQSAPESIGLGSYGTDVHEVRRIVREGVVIREGKIATGRDGAPPYAIGYDAIVPKRGECENLFVTFALSCSHVAFASLRMEPVFMGSSQSAATAAVMAIDRGIAVQDIDYDELRQRLEKDGQVLEWVHAQAPEAVSSMAPRHPPLIDLSEDTARHVIVAQGTEEVYQGHPTTVLLPDGKTMFCVWCINHGGPCGPLKRSDDGGLTWSDLLPVPENWALVRNCPAIYRLADPRGKARLIVFGGQGPDGTMHQSVSEDDGRTWSPMRSNGLVCVMPFCTIVPVDNGTKLIGLTNIRRPGETKDPKSNIIVQSESVDGGLTWSPWRILLDLGDMKPCEPEVIRSPDGKQLLCLLRENVRSEPGRFMTSDNEGRLWSENRPLPPGLHGDRHKAVYAPDGRLVVVFRDMGRDSPTRNHFVAWVGRYEDILEGRAGECKIKLLHSHKGSDCGYPGLELLPDGAFVATTYIKYRPGPEQNSVVSTRFALAEVSPMLRPPGKVSRHDDGESGMPAVKSAPASRESSHPRTTVETPAPTDWGGRAPDGTPARIVVPAPKDPRFHHLGWPKAVRTADGTIVLGFLMGRKHVGENCPAVSLSADGGKTFSMPRRLREFGKDKEYDASGNMALGLANDGAVLLLAHGYSKTSNHIFGWRSTDSGRTWQTVDTAALGPNKTGSSTGHIVQLPGKRLMVVGHYRVGSNPHERGIWRSISEDDGLTWGEPFRVTDYPGVEPVLVRHENRLLVFIRGNKMGDDYRQFLAVSDDWGATWETRPAGIEALLPRPARLAHPFAGVDPQDPDKLIAITFERGKTGTAQLWRGHPRTLEFTHDRTLVELSEQSVKTHDDYGYGWLVPMNERRGLFFYYHGRKDGPSAIWALETEI